MTNRSFFLLFLHFLVSCRYFSRVIAQVPTTIAAWNFDASTSASSGSGTFSSCASQATFTTVTGNPSTGSAVALTNWQTKCTSSCCGFTFCVDSRNYNTLTCAYEVSTSASGGGANILYAFNGATITPVPAATTKASTFISTVVNLPTEAGNLVSACCQIVLTSAPSDTANYRFDNVNISGIYAPTPTPSATATASGTATRSSTVTATRSLYPTNSAQATVSAMASLSPTASSSSIPSYSSTATASISSVPSSSSSAALSSTTTKSANPSVSATRTSIPSIPGGYPTVTRTATGTVSSTVSSTASGDLSIVSTSTTTASSTASASASSTVTFAVSNNNSTNMTTTISSTPSVIANTTVTSSPSGSMNGNSTVSSTPSSGASSVGSVTSSPSSSSSNGTNGDTNATIVTSSPLSSPSTSSTSTASKTLPSVIIRFTLLLSTLSNDVGSIISGLLAAGVRKSFAEELSSILRDPSSPSATSAVRAVLETVTDPSSNNQVTLPYPSSSTRLLQTVNSNSTTLIVKVSAYLPTRSECVLASSRLLQINQANNGLNQPLNVSILSLSLASGVPIDNIDFELDVNSIVIVGDQLSTVIDDGNSNTGLLIGATIGGITVLILGIALYMGRRAILNYRKGISRLVAEPTTAKNTGNFFVSLHTSSTRDFNNANPLASANDIESLSATDTISFSFRNDRKGFAPVGKQASSILTLQDPSVQNPATFPFIKRNTTTVDNPIVSTPALTSETDSSPAESESPDDSSANFSTGFSSSVSPKKSKKILSSSVPSSSGSDNPLRSFGASVRNLAGCASTLSDTAATGGSSSSPGARSLLVRTGNNHASVRNLLNNHAPIVTTKVSSGNSTFEQNSPLKLSESTTPVILGTSSVLSPPGTNPTNTKLRANQSSVRNLMRTTNNNSV